VSQTSFSELELVFIRKHGSALVLPVLILGLDAALFFFVDGRLSEQLHHQLLLSGVLLIALLFWLLPAIRFFTNRIEITSNRVIIHRGLTGNKTEEVPWGEITGVSISRGFGSWIKGAGDIHLHREFGQDAILHCVPRAKKLSREFESYLSSRAKRGTIERG
jgi:prepilin signal peptidase PulO-like enzyme (type II secretory pathway)